MLRKKSEGIMTGDKAKRERGIQTLEWVGLSAVILTLLLGMLNAMPTGGQAIGAQMHSTISNWVEVWSGAGQLGGGLGGGEDTRECQAFGPCEPFPPIRVEPSPDWTVRYCQALGICPGQPFPRIRVDGSDLSDLADPGMSLPSFTREWTAGPTIKSERYLPGYSWEGNVARRTSWNLDTGRRYQGPWKKVKPENVEAYVTLAQDEWSTGDAAFWRAWGTDDAYARAEAGSYRVEGSYSLRRDKNGLSANGSGKAGVYAAKLSGNLEQRKEYTSWLAAERSLRGEAFVGLEGSYEGTFALGERGLTAGLETKAVVAQAQGEATGGLDVAGVKANVVGKAGVWVGLGVEGEVKVGIEDGRLVVRERLDVGAGLGVSQSVGLEIDVQSVASKITDIGRALANPGVSQ